MKSWEILDMLLATGGYTEYTTDLGETVWEAIPRRSNQRGRMEAVLRQHGVSRPTGRHI